MYTFSEQNDPKWIVITDFSAPRVKFYRQSSYLCVLTPFAQCKVRVKPSADACKINHYKIQTRRPLLPSVYLRTQQEKISQEQHRNSYDITRSRAARTLLKCGPAANDTWGVIQIHI